MHSSATNTGIQLAHEMHVKNNDEKAIEVGGKGDFLSLHLNKIGEEIFFSSEKPALNTVASGLYTNSSAASLASLRLPEVQNVSRKSSESSRILRNSLNFMNMIDQETTEKKSSSSMTIWPTGPACRIIWVMESCTI